METRRPQGGVFSHNFEFFQFSRDSVDITVYQYGKNVIYFFYNIAQRTLIEEWREIFRVEQVRASFLAEKLVRLAFKPGYLSRKNCPFFRVHEQIKLVKENL